MSSGKPVLFLHIGAAKSGSSAIQALLHDNAARLRERGVLVPSVDLRPGGAVDGAQVTYFERLLPIDAGAITLVQERLEALASFLRAQGLRAAVVSAENLFNTNEFARLFEAAQDLFEMHIVFYIRRQDEYVARAWNQWYFKSNDDFRTWAATVKGSLANWDVIVSRWEKRLPSAKFDIRVFDRERFHGGDIVQDFLAVLGVDPAGLILPEGSVNRGLNQTAMRVAFRNRGLFDDAQDHRFLEFLAELGGEAAFEPVEAGLYFTPAEQRGFLDAYSESNERLRQRHFPRVEPGALFPGPDAASTQQAAPDETLEHELDLMWAVLFRLWNDGRPRRLR